MNVSQILKTKGDMVFTISPHETVEAASALLFTRKVGAMVVLNEEELVVGILSERDVVRAVAKSGSLALSHPVSDYMTAQVVFAELHETVEALLGRMTDRRVRHLPVCKDRRLVGIISIGDLVKVKIAEVELEAEHLKAYIATG